MAPLSQLTAVAPQKPGEIESGFPPLVILLAFGEWWSGDHVFRVVMDVGAPAADFLTLPTACLMRVCTEKQQGQLS